MLLYNYIMNDQIRKFVCIKSWLQVLNKQDKLHFHLCAVQLDFSNKYIYYDNINPGRDPITLE